MAKPGARRYEQIRAAAAAVVPDRAKPATRISAVSTTSPVSSLQSDLKQLKAAQDKQAEPRWWAGMAAHPVRTAFITIMVLAISGAFAVVGPVALKSYRAYNEIFVTQAPIDQAGLIVELNAEGTPIIVTSDQQTDDTAQISEWDGESRITILLLGVDRREDEYSRSDTIILVNIDPKEKTARMISIPRDLRLIIPGYGSEKINAAYAFGDANEDVPGRGPGLMMRTIEQNFGIDIDYYAEIDFNGFVEIVDTVGGVTLNVPYPIRDNEYPGPNNQYMRIFFPSGWQHMDGSRVLQYSRTRHDDSDVYRSARQQQVLLALRQQALDTDLINKAPQLIDDVAHTFRTDLSLGQVLSLARIATEIDQGNIQQLSLDPALWAIDDGGFYFQGDWLAIGEIMSDFTGVTIVPPMSALANPRYDTGISILDGTLISGLGGRVLDVVNENGFEDATTVDLPDAGNYPLTRIIVSPDNIATGYLLAGILGVPESAIETTDVVETPVVAPTLTPAVQLTPGADEASPVDGTVAIRPLFPTAEGNENQGPAGKIVIMLGDDLPDPAWFIAP